MSMIDATDPLNEKQVQTLELYLTEEQAKSLRTLLDDLLQNPESLKHHHLRANDFDLSFSVVTKSKLAEGHWTDVQRELLQRLLSGD